MNKTERAIIHALAKRGDHIKRYEMMIPNCFNTKFGDNEADFFAIRRSGLCDEFEVKVSRSDLLADKNKMVQVRDRTIEEYMTMPDDKSWLMPKHEALEAGLLPVNYFWYAIRAGIGALTDIPDFAGLLVVEDDGRCRVVRYANKLKKDKLPLEDKYHYARKIQFRYWNLELKQSAGVEGVSL